MSFKLDIHIQFYKSEKFKTTDLSILETCGEALNGMELGVEKASFGLKTSKKL